MDLKSTIRVIEDFPKEGISFKDITTLLKDGEAFKKAVDLMAEDLKNINIDIIASPEARGFMLGTALSYKLGVGFVPIRKPGKLPCKVRSYEYELEYGFDAVEVHEDAIQKGMKVAVIDDLLATGGTVEATIELIKSLGGEVSACEFLIELTDLNGRDKLNCDNVNSVITYPF